MTTVYDIARTAGVSVATVSRVINGHTNVTEKTRERVQKLIRESGFRPNANARRLVHGSSGQICFLLCNRSVVHSFHSRILMGVEDFCRQSGLDVVFTTFDYQPEDRFPSGTVPRVIREHSGTEGLLLAGTNYPNFLEHLDSLGLPYVFFGNNLVTGSLELPTGHCVCFDEQEGGEKAAAFLAELGHREIRFVGDLSKPWYQRRYEGYKKALETRGLEPAAVDVRDASSSFELGKRAAGVLIHRHRGTTAVLAQDDETACGLLDGFRRIGVRVPGDISLMGYDDITEIQYLNPSLTTVRVRKEQIGTTMAAELLRLRESGRQGSPAAILPTEIVVRDSCSKVPEPMKAVPSRVDI